ncbi:MAG: ABC transporter ATP-binding protein [Spirochaetaceae bacterium]|nr:ABC transporter ATP-binding protein [Spirochaetaceae bacterium]
MAPLIEVENLKKSYQTIEAVRGIDFQVAQHSFFAFLGPNGAGKSTTINILCTLLEATSGTVTIAGKVLGRQDDEIRRLLGVVFQRSLLDDSLTVRENLDLRGSFYGLSKGEIKNRIQETAEELEMQDYLDQYYGTLSGGQRRRADIARALIHRPPILFLDEPTTGLDPQTRLRMWESLKKLQSRKEITLFLTTHYMEEAASADHVAILDKGLLKVQGTPAELRQKYCRDHLRLIPKDENKIRDLLKGYELIQRPGYLELPLKDSLQGLPVLNKVENHLQGFELIRGTMDDVFIAVTGRQIREDL